MLTNEDVKQLLEQSDLLDMYRRIGWYSAPESGFKKHGASLIRAVESAVLAKLREGGVGLPEPYRRDGTHCYTSTQLLDYGDRRVAAAAPPKNQPSFNTESDCEKNHRECEAPDLCQKFGRCCGA